MRACCLWQGRVARGKGMGPNLGLSWAQGVLTPCASLIHHHFTIACGWSQTGALKTMLSWLPSQGSDPPCPAQQPNCPAQQPRQPNCHGYPAKAVIPPVLRNSLTVLRNSLTVLRNSLTVLRNSQGNLTVMVTQPRQ